MLRSKENLPSPEKKKIFLERYAGFVFNTDKRGYIPPLCHITNRYRAKISSICIEDAIQNIVLLWFEDTP